MSLPVRGAWIEIPARHSKRRCTGRSPCGERGLKYIFLRFFQDFILSLPVRGAWIEITDTVVPLVV